MCHCSGLANKIIPKLIEKGIKVSTVECCTDGKLYSFISDADVTNEVIGSCIITNNTGMLNMYSRETAECMTKSELASSKDICIGVTGNLKAWGNGDKNIVFYNIYSESLKINETYEVVINKHNPIGKQKDIVCRQILKSLLELL